MIVFYKDSKIIDSSGSVVLGLVDGDHQVICCDTNISYSVKANLGKYELGEIYPNLFLLRKAISNRLWEDTLNKAMKGE